MFFCCSESCARAARETFCESIGKSARNNHATVLPQPSIDQSSASVYAPKTYTVLGGSNSTRAISTMAAVVAKRRNPFGESSVMLKTSRTDVDLAGVYGMFPYDRPFVAHSCPRRKHVEADACGRRRRCCRLGIELRRCARPPRGVLVLLADVCSERLRVMRAARVPNVRAAMRSVLRGLLRILHDDQVRPIFIFKLPC